MSCYNLLFVGKQQGRHWGRWMKPGGKKNVNPGFQVSCFCNQCLCVLAGVGRGGPGVLRGEACSRVLHWNLNTGIKPSISAFQHCRLCICEQREMAMLSFHSHLALLWVIGCSLGLVRARCCASLRILGLAVHRRLLTESTKVTLIGKL